MRVRKGLFCEVTRTGDGKEGGGGGGMTRGNAGKLEFHIFAPTQFSPID